MLGLGSNLGGSVCQVKNEEQLFPSAPGVAAQHGAAFQPREGGSMEQDLPRDPWRGFGQGSMEQGLARERRSMEQGLVRD